MNLCYMDHPLNTLGIAHLLLSLSYLIKGVLLTYSSSSSILQVELSLVGGRFGTLSMLGS